MKNYIFRTRLFTVVFFVLVIPWTYVCGEPKPTFFVTLSKNSENISIKIENDISLQIMCTSGSDAELFESFQLPIDKYRVISEINIDSCPKIVVKSMGRSVISHITGTSLKFKINNVTTLPESIFDGITNLTTLDIGNNNLLTLPENVFDGLTHLESLSIARNHLTTLHPNIFDRLINLKFLNLWDNHLTALSGNIFKRLTNLETLFISTNHLTTLPETIFNGLFKLKTLHLWDNRFESLSENLFNDLINLNMLTIGSNKLTTLPAYIFRNNSNLNELHLYDNPWKCDCNLIQIFQTLDKKKMDFYLNGYRCANGQLLQNEIKKPISPDMVIINYSNVSNYFNRKFYGTCFKNSTNELIQICPAECSCLLPDDQKTIIFDCSNRHLKSLPASLGNGHQQLPAIQEIELIIDNNNIESLPNSTVIEFNLITRISAKNNSIESISVDNLPTNLTEIDLSENRLKLLSSEVIENLSKLNKVVLGGNPWDCDDLFFDFIRFNIDKVDYKHIICNDGESFEEKHNRLMFWITDDVSLYETSKNSSEIIRRLSHSEAPGKICPPKCNCVVKNMNQTILMECDKIDVFSFFDIQKNDVNNN